jgi:hypothetical protein
MQIIRVGDEKRSMIEDHIIKVRDSIVSHEALNRHRALAIETFVQVATNLPHKAFVYGALLAYIAQKEESLVRDIAHRLVEALQTSLVEQRNVHASKNITRVIAIAVEYGVVSTQVFSQTLLQLLDECNSMAGGKISSSDLDLILETIMAGLPIASPRLSTEQGLDFGTILESLRKLFS